MTWKSPVSWIPFDGSKDVLARSRVSSWPMRGRITSACNCGSQRPRRRGAKRRGGNTNWRKGAASPHFRLLLTPVTCRNSGTRQPPQTEERTLPPFSGLIRYVSKQRERPTPQRVPEPRNKNGALSGILRGLKFQPGGPREGHPQPGRAPQGAVARVARNLGFKDRDVKPTFLWRSRGLFSFSKGKRCFSFPLIGGLDWWFGGFSEGFPCTLFKKRFKFQTNPNHQAKSVANASAFSRSACHFFSARSRASSWRGSGRITCGASMRHELGCGCCGKSDPQSGLLVLLTLDE